MTGHTHTRARVRESAVLTAILLASMFAAPGPLQAVDPTPAPPDQGEMFRQPEGTTGTDPRAPRAPAVMGPAGFHESTVIQGLIYPTALAFAADGRVFVAEKRGTIKVYDSLSDPTPTTYADLGVNVYDYWDRGLLGLALDPAFTTNGRVYVLYTFNHILGEAAGPKWVNAQGQDVCLAPPAGPGSTIDGCVASARLSRLETNGAGVWDGNEHVLIEGWCQVHPSHTIGTVAFGPDGALYAGAGDAASFVNRDWGQDFGASDAYTPDNPCGDPPSPVGTELYPPIAEGGALRSQDLRTTADPTGLDGAIIRVDPTTGAAMPTNANAVSGMTDLNAKRIIAYGLRNPYRFAFRPGTNEIWIGDVGDQTWEEFNRVVSPTAPPANFGWPCYEGVARKPSFDDQNLNICESLYSAGTAQAPYYVYKHSDHVVPNDGCPNGAFSGSVISGAAFYPLAGGNFPAAYRGALFFADYARNCIWAVPAGAGGLPDKTRIETFASGLSGPVDLKVGPDGALYYVAFDAPGTVRRISVGPTAIATANPMSGATPLFVQFNGAASTDPEGGTLTYAWDLDGDGLFDDSTAVAPTKTYTVNGLVVARLKVTDSLGAFDIASVTINVGNHPPVAKIATPSSSLTWSVGDTISFSGSATDAEDGVVLPSKLAWEVLIQHCPDACHNHVIQTGTGSGGSFPAPNHPYPSSLVIGLVATDFNGAASAKVTVKLLPKTVALSVASAPAGVPLTLGDTTAAAPFTQTVINKSFVQVTAPATATIGGRPYAFSGWSDGKARTHSFTALSTTPPLVATYAPGTTFVPIPPVRVVDTRVGQTGPMTAGVTRTFAVAGTHGIPTNAIAITGNLTAVLPTRAGWIELATAPGGPPTTSSLNLPAGDIRANGVMMRLGSDGRLSAVYRAPSGTSHLILDVTGYFLPTSTGATFTPLGPTRVLDSRFGIGGFSSPFVSGTPRTIKLTGVGGVPADAVAVTGNLTVTGQTAGGYVAMTTAATSSPAVSTVNVPVGDTRANGLTIKLDANGRASLVYIGGTPGVAKANLIFDVTGFYRAGTAGLRFYPIAGRRIFDTRAGNSPSLQAGVPRAIDVVGPGAIADGAVAVATNVTVTGQSAAGYLAVTTVSTANPTTSTINFPLSDTRANNTVNALDSSGRLRAIYKAPAGSRLHFIVDLNGFFR